jgi:hypothetical protein
MRGVVAAAAITLALLQGAAFAQVPQPFPRPRDQQAPPRPAPSAPGAPSAPQPAQPAQPPPAAAPASADPAGAPSEATLGFPLYPNSQFLTSYDAGKGQRYFLFGSMASFAELVKYYQAVLKTKGTLVFEAPATHIFEAGKFREEAMAFPVSVTVKDYTWGNSPGYLNPKAGATPARFPSIVQIVPAPAGTAAR